MPELMISLVILIIILGITGAIYKSSADAVDKTNAGLELQQRADIIKRQLQADLGSITKDGYLILVRRDRTGLSEVNTAGAVVCDGLTARADQVLFWRTGDFQSFTDDNATSNLCAVFYTHSNFSSAVGAYGDNATDTSPVNRWGYSRLFPVYVPGYSGTATGWNVLNYSFGAEMRAFSYGYQRQLATPSLTEFDDNVTRWINASQYIDNMTRDCHWFLSSGCGSVRIRFLLPFEDIDHNSTLDTGEDDGDNGSTGNPVHLGNWPPDNGNGNLDRNVWLDLPERNSAHPACSPGNVLHTIGGCGVVCFTPNNELWPTALEFTVRLYDQNLSVRSMDEDLSPPREHGGMTYRFIVRLP